MIEPIIGETLHYRLTKEQAEQINRRRTSSQSIAQRSRFSTWPVGAQAHIGNTVSEGDVFPLIVTRTWHKPGAYVVGQDKLNGQALLDGNDVLWVTSVVEGTGPGTWSHPLVDYLPQPEPLPAQMPVQDAPEVAPAEQLSRELTEAARSEALGG